MFTSIKIDGAKCCSYSRKGGAECSLGNLGKVSQGAGRLSLGGQEEKGVFLLEAQLSRGEAAWKKLACAVTVPALERSYHFPSIWSKASATPSKSSRVPSLSHTLRGPCPFTSQPHVPTVMNSFCVRFGAAVWVQRTWPHTSLNALLSPYEILDNF